MILCDQQQLFLRNFLIPDNTINRLNLLYKLLTGKEVVISATSAQGRRPVSCWLLTSIVWLLRIATASDVLTDKKTRQMPGFSVKRINVLSTVDAYALCADRLSYVQPDERRG